MFVFLTKLSPALQNYSTLERECLTIICALVHFRVYLLRRRFRLRTDHRALAWWISKELKASARISGWFATLMEYPIVIEYMREAENSIAEALVQLDLIAVDKEFLNELRAGFFRLHVFSLKWIVSMPELTGLLSSSLMKLSRS